MPKIKAYVCEQDTWMNLGKIVKQNGVDFNFNPTEHTNNPNILWSQINGYILYRESLVLDTRNGNYHIVDITTISPFYKTLFQNFDFLILLNLKSIKRNARKTNMHPFFSDNFLMMVVTHEIIHAYEYSTFEQIINDEQEPWSFICLTEFLFHHPEFRPRLPIISPEHNGFVPNGNFVPKGELLHITYLNENCVDVKFD